MSDDITLFFDLLESKPVKAACKMLIKSTPDVNFTNILQAAFTQADPKRAKKTVRLSVLLHFLGSAQAKAAC